MIDELQIRVERTVEGATVTIAGEIDRAAADRLRTALDSAGADGNPITIDLTAVTYLDSTGVAVLFEHLDGRAARIVADSGCLVRPVLDITGLPVRPLGDSPST